MKSGNRMALGHRAAAMLYLGAMAGASAALADEPARRFDLGTIELLEVRGERERDWFDPLAARIGIDDLRRFDRTDVVDAVRMLPGVDVQQVGARSERLVFVRGFNSRQVPLFIDGIPVYVPYDGNIDLARMTVADIGEVTVTRGFTSMLYGANTLGGSINVVTRRPTGEFEIDTAANVGVADGGGAQSYALSVNAGANRGTWYAQAGLSRLERDHFTLPDGFTPTAAEDGGRRNNSDSRDDKLSLKVGLTPNERDEYALVYQLQQGRKNTPPYAGTTPGVAVRFWQWPVYDKESLYFIGRKGFGDATHVRARLYYDKFDNTLRSFDDASYTTQTRPFAFNSVYDDYTWGAGLEFGRLLGDRHDLRLAAHYKVDVHRERDNIGAPRERYEDSMLSLGTEGRFELAPAWTLVAGASWDALEGERADDVASGPGAGFPLTSEDAVNAQAGVLYALSDTTTARVSIARRTRFPTIKDRYSFRLGSAIPNPELDPESALNVEVGLDGASTFRLGDIRLRWSLALYASELDDAIESVSIAPTACTSPPCSQLQNIGEQRHRGIETQITADFGARVSVHLNHAWLDKENRTNPDLKPLDVPGQTLFGYLSYRLVERVELLATVEAAGRRYNTTNGLRRASGHGIGGLKASWQVTPAVTLEGGVRNIADRLYTYEDGFYEQGRNYFLNMRWSP